MDAHDAKSKMIVFTAVLACAIFSGQVALSMDLNQFKWENRLLLLFAPQDNDASFRALYREISAQPLEISDRDLVVFRILESGPSYMSNTRIEPTTAAILREKFAVPVGNFTCILIGKDGGVKLKQTAQIKIEHIFALIDAMPMRREEMRKKGQGSEFE
jgi:hypothetical protein